MVERRIFNVSGMHCAGCASVLEKAVKNLPGTADVYVNFASGRLSFFSEKDIPGDEEVLALIRKTGFKGSLPEPVMKAEKDIAWYREFSGFFTALFFTLLLSVVCFGKIPADFRLKSVQKVHPTELAAVPRSLCEMWQRWRQNLRSCLNPAQKPVIPIQGSISVPLLWKKSPVNIGKIF